MKSICTLLTALITCCVAQAQAVLNEIYAYPGATGHEFFELYNNTPGGLPVSVDDYTFITYFEEGSNTKGFYIMNLPSDVMAPGGYYVGAAADPFNFQGTIGSTAANFNWNSTDLADNHGYLKKMVWSQAAKAYVEAPMPLFFNDFFSHLNGSGASYSTFLFRDNKLINVFLGGTGGQTGIPKYITDMPPLPVNVLTENDPSREVIIDFENYINTRTEYVIQDIGSDNGYMRTSDGMCGEWEKSSAQAFHTPSTTNGGDPMLITGSFTVQTHIYRGVAADDAAFIVYDITAGPDYLLPAHIFIYEDLGATPGRWDAGDVLIDQQMVASIADGPMTTTLTNKDADIIMIVKTTLGCLDHIRFLVNEEIEPITLPVRLLSFNGTLSNNKATLTWAVTENESAKHYEVEKSSDGSIFTSVSVIEGSNKTGYGYYSYNDAQAARGNTHYRLKIVSKDNTVTYSPVIVVKNGAPPAATTLQILQNPVKDRLVCVYNAITGSPTTFSIYNTAGVKLHSQTVSTHKGLNTFIMDLGGKISSGTYILEVANSTERSTAKFLRY